MDFNDRYPYYNRCRSVTLIVSVYYAPLPTPILKKENMFSTYKNVPKGIGQDYSFLHKFFRNLLMGENNELKNR